ncbi:MAG: Crp/Fnr family transcriptional regulator [Lautropia sp.]|nr:Crp/Fnr family transcriptional regulator [Lautropia sp.]
MFPATFKDSASGPASASSSGFRHSPDDPLLHVLAAHPLFAGLPPEVLGKLAENAWKQTLSAGESVFHEGDPATHYLLIVSGQIEMVRFSQEGDEHVFQSFGPESIVAEASIFMQHGRYPMSSRAGDAPVTLWRLSGASLRAACEAHGPLAMRLLYRFSQRLYHRVNEVEWLTSSTAQQRLAAYFLSLVTQQGLELVFPQSQRHVAAQLGIRPETLNRLLADWQQRGWIQGSRRHWQVCDKAPIARMAEGKARPF